MLDFDDEFDEICWCSEHPTPEFYNLIKKVNDFAKSVDLSTYKTEYGKLK